MTRRPPRLSALLPMAYNGVGPAATCVNLMRGLARDGVDCMLHLDVARRRIEGAPHAATVPALLGLAPYRMLQKRASPATEARYLADLREGDLAYLWPTASLAAHHAAAARGAPIILEGINTRMASAKRILDAVYAEAGLPPAHGVTEARIAEEDEKIALADAVFCPSPGVEAALCELPGAAARVLSASYGVTVDPAAPPRVPAPGPGLRVLFVGSVCLRKGAHKLLAAWAEARVDGVLTLLGDVEPAIAARFADLLNGPTVRKLGFRRDVAAHYAEADLFVLPSFEEGDALVTYEAAKFGLPMILSPMGAGRFGAAHPDCVRMIDPWDVASITAALRELADSADRRAALGQRAREAVRAFDWTLVAARRAALLRARYSLT